MNTLIRDCTIIDVQHMGKIEHASVLVSDGKISRILEASKETVPNEDVDSIIEAHGKFLVPGMINLHVHIQRRHLHLPGKGVFRQGLLSLKTAPTCAGWYSRSGTACTNCIMA
jgi:cytosine/adenosine deaminase-related metal-dependent hydrolase